MDGVPGPARIVKLLDELKEERRKRLKTGKGGKGDLLIRLKGLPVGTTLNNNTQADHVTSESISGRD